MKHFTFVDLRDMKSVYLIFLLLALASCSDEIARDYNGANNNFNIYLVKPDDKQMIREVVDLESLNLESEPWVKSGDIEFYDWSAHAFYLKKDVEKSKYSTRNFVVSSGRKRLFIGVFWPWYMSSIPMIPAILPEEDWRGPRDVVLFNAFGWHFPGNLDENEEFKRELIIAGLLREGIKVKIIRLRKINSSTLDYTFTVTNLETRKIYVADPDRMGAAHFHYYTNGVGLQQNDKYYWPQNFHYTEPGKFSQNWYYGLKPGESITRTIAMEGYTNLPTGKVKASFYFPGASRLGSKEWKKPDGRIWIGSFRSETEITID